MAHGAAATAMDRTCIQAPVSTKLVTKKELRSGGSRVRGSGPCSIPPAKRGLGLVHDREEYARLSRLIKKRALVPIKARGHKHRDVTVEVSERSRGPVRLVASDVEVNINVFVPSY